MKKLKHYLKEILVTLIIAAIVMNIVSYYRSQSVNQEQLPLQNIQLNNQALMVHFWATWCPVCKVEASNIQQVSKNFNVLTIAVNSGSDENIDEYLKKNNLDFKVINDDTSSYARQFNIKVFPTTIIYDKNKNIVFSEVGYTSTFGLYLRMWWANL
jgi:thiol-disulfide isomerase/thioredoxin